MARQIKAWLGSLIEAEVENVIAWKRVVKQEPDTAGVEEYDRFRDDGSNFRSTVGTPPLTGDCKVQILRTPESRREPALVTDGETQVKAKLSAAAWDSYEDALDGEDSMRGDILICTGVTVCSTPFGPLDDRVQLLLTRVGFKGDNVRKTVGQPVAVEKRPRILELLDEITRLTALLNSSGMDECTNDDQDEIMPDAGPQASAGVQQEISDLRQAVETQVPQQPSGQLFETQAPVLEAPLPSRNHPRAMKSRGRGGLSLARDGVEAARGVNLTQPQAPGLTIASRKRKHDPLLSLLNNEPAAPLQRSPAVHTTPKSAQVVQEDTVLETPARSAKHNQGIARHHAASTNSTERSSRPLRKPYRIPAAQRRLLENKSSWCPAAPGARFPHPNVPVALLEKWNSQGQPRSQSAPKLPIEISFESEDSDTSSDTSEAQPGAAESASEDEQPLAWSPSPSQQNKLPPDSSADSPLKRRASVDPARKPLRHETIPEDEAEQPERSRPSTSYSNRSLPKSSATPTQSKPQSQVPVNGSARSASSRNGTKRQASYTASPRDQQPKPSPSNLITASPMPRKSTPVRPPAQASQSQRSQRSSLANQELANTRTFKKLNISPPKGPAWQTRVNGGFMMQPPAAIKHPSRPKHVEKMSASSQQASQARPTPSDKHQSSHKGPHERSRESTHWLSSSRPTSAGGSVSSQQASQVKPTPSNTHQSSRNILNERSHEATQRHPYNCPPSVAEFHRSPSTDPRVLRYSQEFRPSQEDQTSLHSPASQQAQTSGRDFIRPPPTGPRAERDRPPREPPRQSDDMEMDMDVPRALNSNYRQVRSEFFRGAGRRRYIQTQLPALLEQNPRLDFLLSSYHAAKPLDPVSAEDFLKAIELLAPESLAEIDQTTTPSPQRSSPSPTQDSWPVAEESFTSTPVNPFAARQREQRQEPEQSSVSVSRDAQNGERGRGSAAEGTVEANGAEQIASNAMKADLERRVQGLSAFEEFALRWKSICPGGAFAKNVSMPREGGGSRRLNVLGWEL